MNDSILRRRLAPLAVAGATALVLAACGSGNDPANTAGEDGGEGGNGSGELSGSVNVDGSSTVFPLTSAAAELFGEEQPGVRVSVGQSGTGGGFEKFCAGETDISDASREISDDEAALCEENGVSYDELSIANDGLTVVVNADNDWAECLTVEQLNTIWAPDSTVSNWNEVDPSFPDEPLTLAGPGTDSGTFDYFTDAINDEEGASRTDFEASEDDNVIVQAVQGSRGGMGYFGFSYYEENQDTLKALEVDGGDGCVAPSIDTVQDGSYQPLGRQLFIYPSAEAIQTKPEVEAFVDFYVDNIDEIVEAAAFIGLNDEQKAELEQQVEQLRG
ncbi:MAG TPA: PstS family phosphate ABC transporter substrate-binding protein [Jiangellales bacterium]|nr:PstS family phosphate ABC transporter substrate-binding protein [Jiangellales bacterium]